MIAPISSLVPGMAGAEAPSATSPYSSAATVGSPGSGTPAASFAEELAGAVGNVEARARVSDALRDKLLRGENVELHTVAIQAQEAQISFELLLQVRNKLIQGYQEIMRMQI